MVIEEKEMDFKPVLAKYPARQTSDLIPILQDVQHLQGYISPEAVREISKHLDLPTSKIFGVATFYNQFRLEPPGRHMILVCRGTACHVKGSGVLLEALERELNVKVKGTTRDRRFTLETVACIGACSIAPVLCIDGEYHGKVTGDQLPEILKQYK